MLESLYKKVTDRRYNSFIYVIAGLFMLLVLRLFVLQLIDGEHYRELADGNRIRQMTIQATRGVLLDRNGKIIVGSRPVYIVSYTPQQKPMDAALEARLANVLQMTPADIQKKIKDHGTSFGPVPIKVDIGPDIVAKIEEYRAEYPGVTIEVQPLRYYPYGSLAANVIGYVGEAGPEDRKADGSEFAPGTIVGRAGLELYYNDLLQGETGGRQVEVDATGRPVKNIEEAPITPGHNLQLTLDLPLQRATEAAISEHLSELAKSHIWPTGVAAVALDPNTGAVLAMANWPSFNPNSFAVGISAKEWQDLNENSLRPFDDRVVSGTYPPGSIFKVITGTAALNAKVITPEERIYDNGRHWLIDKRNAAGEAFGWINFQEAMAKSDNVYFYELGNRLGIDRISEMARAFGLGEATGIDLYGEASGLVATEQYKKEVFHDDWYLGETFDAAIGQSFNLATPLQMASVVSQIANGGTRYKPYLVSRINHLDGSPYQIHQPQVTGRLVVPKSVLDTVKRSMWAVTQEGGTAGALFHGYPIEVGGKTATAETGDGPDHAWFAAFAPYDNPQIVIVVLVEHAGYGIESAAPIVKQMLDAYFHIPTAKQ